MAGSEKLGVPCVVDRLIQQALLQVLQERWDPTFSEHSYGFRPGRSAHQAVAQAQRYVAEGYSYVVDLDLEKFFDRVNHDKLMARVAARVSDKRVLKFIRACLKAGVMEDGLVRPVDEGTPQGGPFTPPTIWQKRNLRTVPAGMGGKWSDAENDADGILVDLDALDEKADQLPLPVPIDLGELSAHLAGKILEPSDQERQCGPQRLVIEQSLALLLQTGQTPAQASQARLELGLIDQALGVAVDQPADPPVQLGDLPIEQGCIGTRGIALADLDEPPL